MHVRQRLKCKLEGVCFVIQTSVVWQTLDESMNSTPGTISAPASDSVEHRKWRQPIWENKHGPINVYFETGCLSGPRGVFTLTDLGQDLSSQAKGLLIGWVLCVLPDAVQQLSPIFTPALSAAHKHRRGWCGVCVMENLGRSSWRCPLIKLKCDVYSRCRTWQTERRAGTGDIRGRSMKENGEGGGDGRTKGWERDPRKG